MFLTDKAAKERIAGLETQVADLEANAATQDAEISRLQGELATSNESLLTANGQTETLTADLAAATASLATKETELATAKEAVTGFETKVENAALAKFQALGGEATKAGSEGGGSAKIMNRAAFNALSAAERQAFSQSGGKLTD